MSTMNRMSSRSRKLAFGSLVFALLLFVPNAAAQLEAGATVSAEEFGGEAMPTGAPAVTNFTISYNCGGYDGDVTVSAEADANVSGASATVEPSTFTAVTAPTCTPGSAVDPPAGPFKLSVSAGPEALAGTEIPVKIKVQGANVLSQDQEEPGGADVVAIVGPYVDVTFEAKTTAFEVPAGDAATVVVTITSNSNAMVMAMPDLQDLPDTWPKPDIFPMNIESPLVEGQNGTSAFQFDVSVPADTEPGEYVLNFSTFAHSMTDTYVESPTQTIPLTFTVTEGAGGGGDGDDAEESPPLAPFPLVILGAALLVLLRRRD